MLKLLFHKSLKIMQVGQSEDIFNYTTCGEGAFKRGVGQKVISFSFYEHDDTRASERKLNRLFEYPGYFRGIEENLLLQPSFYPSWTIRLYLDLQQDDPLMETLQSYSIKYDYLDICHVMQLPNQLLKGNMERNYYKHDFISFRC